MKNLTEGKPIRVITGFALPIFIGNLFNLAYNLADTRVIGSYLGNDALAAVGSVSTLSDLLVGFVVGLANGFAVLTAQQYGRRDEDGIRKSFALSLLLGLIITAVIMSLGIPGLPGILRLLNVTGAGSEAAATYIRIIIFGLLFGCVYNVLAGSLRAIGDAFTPLLFLIFSAIVNVILDITFVGKFGFGVAGAAIATVLSQLLSAVICFVYTWRKYEVLRFTLRDFVPTRWYAHQLLAGGFSMGLMSSLVSIGTVTLQSAINTFGTNTIVAHTAARKLTNLYMMPFSSLGTTMATYSGQNHGAGRHDRIKQGLFTTLGMSYIWVGVVILMSHTICPVLIRMITATTIQEVLDTSTLYLKVDTAFYLLVPTITILRNSLQGMGDHITPIISSSLELIGKVAIALLLAPRIGYWGIILAEPIVWSIMVIPLIISMVGLLKKSFLYSRRTDE